MRPIGFSAFLKIISLAPGPQHTALRQRLASRSGGDFHATMRRHARGYLWGGESLDSVLAAAGEITDIPKRESTLAALQRLATWRNAQPSPTKAFAPVIFDSPRGIFRVKFEPDFSITMGGQTVAIHIWNTKSVQLALGPLGAALSHVADAYWERDVRPDDVAVLSLREPTQLYRRSDSPNAAVQDPGLLFRIEDMIRPPAPKSRPGEDRPPPP